jgi:hypothetical protein
VAQLAHNKTVSAMIMGTMNFFMILPLRFMPAGN